jgi:hypothetical protein
MKIDMKKFNTGGPAFPHVFDDTQNKQRVVFTGMTLRDYFAAKAMQGWLASFVEDAPTNVHLLAKYSYEVADAMLNRRVE